MGICTKRSSGPDWVWHQQALLGVLYGLVPIAIPIPVFLLGLGLFTSGIQALVFATLTGAYLGESIE